MSRLVDMVNFFNKTRNDLGVQETISDNLDYESVVSNIKEYPHSIIFMAVLDKDNQDGSPESFAYKYLSANHDFSFYHLSKISYDQFSERVLMADVNLDIDSINLLFDAIQTIKNEFHSNASNIWNDSPSSYILKQRLMMFRGINQEKANILSIMLVQKFNIRLADKKDINISYDARIIATMKEIGLINNKNDSYDNIKNLTKKISPNYPGLFDGFFYMIGTYLLSDKLVNDVTSKSKEILILDCISAIRELKDKNII